MAAFGADVLGSVISNVISDFIERRKINRWVQLLIEIHLSYLCAGSFAAGSMLVAHQPLWFAAGTGLMSGAAAAATRFMLSPLTKGLGIQVPPDLVDQAKAQGNEELKGGQKP